MKLFGAMLVRNEAAPDRFLRDVLFNMGQWCDRILVLDDGSTDETVAVCREAGAIVVQRQSPDPMWGNESAARKELWDLAAENAVDHRAWVLFQDADMLLSRNPRPLMGTEHLNTWCWGLRDLWDATHYRVDGPWAFGKAARPWMVNPALVPDGWVAGWSGRGLHAGHLPSNWPAIAQDAPPQYYWDHYSYSTPALRQAKYERYLTYRDHLSPFEQQHAESILDPTPELSP